MKLKKVSKDIVEITRVHGLHGYTGDLFVRVLPLWENSITYDGG